MRFPKVKPMRPSKLRRLVARRIAAYEHDHGMTSEEMVRRVNAGTMEATTAVHRWLMDLHLRDAALPPRSEP